jgi:hypothetical protein
MLHACTRRVNGHAARSTKAAAAWSWKTSGASAISDASGRKENRPRNHGLTVSRYMCSSIAFEIVAASPVAVTNASSGYITRSLRSVVTRTGGTDARR